MENLFFYDTQIGKIAITENGEGVTALYTAHQFEIQRDMQVQETPLLAQTAQQLREYLDGGRKNFTVPLAPQGTAFQQAVWSALQTIPYGEVWSYKQVAQAIGKPTAARAVGMANNKNPVLIMVPCHRVVGCNGKLVGYAAGLPLKEQLLHLESGAPRAKDA